MPRRLWPLFTGDSPAERAKLELLRDEHLRLTRDEEKRYQIAKDLSTTSPFPIIPPR